MSAFFTRSQFAKCRVAAKSQVNRASTDAGSVEGGRCAISSGCVATQLSLHRRRVGGSDTGQCPPPTLVGRGKTGQLTKTAKRCPTPTLEEAKRGRSSLFRAILKCHQGIEGTHHFGILVAAWRKQCSPQKLSRRGLPEYTPHAKRLYPFLPSNIVTDCADL